MNCTVCDSSRRSVFRHRVLARHDVEYLYCDNCGLLQTEPPYWLDEAYSNPIADTDTGIVMRNRANCELATVVLDSLFGRRGRFLDVAGGYGLLTRMLRDRGFDCWSTDKYCQNLVASAFEAPPDLKPDAMFAFEVLEHVPDPLKFLQEIFEQRSCTSLIFSTQTFNSAPPDSSWWYYAFDTGQHITFYQPRTLEVIAAKLKCHYFMVNSGTHIFSPRPLPVLLRTTARRPLLMAIRAAMLRRQRRDFGLTWSDHLHAQQVMQSAASPPPPPPTT